MARPQRVGLTVGFLMTLIALAGVALGMYRLVSGTERAGRTEAVMVVHVIGLGVLVPLGTFAAYQGYAAGRPDQARRAEVALASGCVAWVFVFGSLAFWFLVMVLGVSDR